MEWRRRRGIFCWSELGGRRWRTLLRSFSIFLSPSRFFVSFSVYYRQPGYHREHDGIRGAFFFENSISSLPFLSSSTKKS